MKSPRRRKPVPNDPMPVIKLVSDHPKRKIKDDIVAMSKVQPGKVKLEDAFTIPTFPKGVGPSRAKSQMAMDNQIIEVNAWAAQSLYAGAFNNGATFLGYPYLAQLAQVAEYRKITETLALHMTRKFITLQVAGEEEGEEVKDRSTKIKELTEDLAKFKVQDVLRQAVEVDGFYGRSHLYFDFGYQTPDELKMPIGNGRNDLSQLKVKKNSLKGFKVIEPVWTYPSSYNSNNPLDGAWYNPQSWFIMQKEVHESRCMRLVGREVPDLLKPAYAFGGLSMSQMAKPYVDNWLRTRQSVADVLWSFSTSGIKTDLSTLMQTDGADLFARAELFNNLKNSRGMMMLNMDSEEFFQVNTPLSTLDKLQAQAQEHMASVSSIPLVFLLGITPSGLNASSEGEIRAFYDWIAAFQKKFFTEPLDRILGFMQLSRYGEVDPSITYKFEPLWSTTEKEEAEIDKMEAETDNLRVDGGIISPLEARTALANDADSRYAGLDTTVLPVKEGGGEEDPFGGEDPMGPDEDPIDPDGNGEGPIDPSGAQDDATWNESKHPRGQPGNAGQFGPGGSGAGGPGPAGHEDQDEYGNPKITSKPKSYVATEISKQITSVVNKTAGISGKYRQNIKNLLKEPTISPFEKTALQKKLIESYEAKAQQLTKANDPDAKSVQAKADKLKKALGLSVAAPAKPATSSSSPVAKHTVSTSNAQPDKFIVLNSKGEVLGNNGEFGKGIPTKKFDSKAAAEAYAKFVDDNPGFAGSPTPSAGPTPQEIEANKKKIEEMKAAEKAAQFKSAIPEYDSMSDEDKEAIKDLDAFGKVEYNYKTARELIKSVEHDGKLTAARASHILAYTGNSYIEVNQQLRSNLMEESTWNHAKQLNEALSHLPKYTKPTTRRTTIPMDQLKNWEPGKIVADHGFMSTTKKSKPTFGGNSVITIHGKNGRDISGLSHHSDEAEVLFPAGSRFKVESKTMMNGQHQITLREV